MHGIRHPLGYRAPMLSSRRALVVATLAFAVASIGAVAWAAQTGGSAKALSVRPVLRGFDTPVLLTAPRSEPGKLYVVEQGGRILRVSGGTRRVFLDIRAAVVAGGERGLLGLAFHPRYPKDRRLYVAYTSTGGQNVVVEYRANAAGTKALPSTRRLLFAVADPYDNHNGGHLAFGRDGFLYTSIGDGGSGGDPENRSQNPDSPFGKLLRFNVNARPARAEIAALGLRNPWRFSFDRANGDLYIGDVGQGAVEEIDYTPYQSPGLENYEWDVREGSQVYENKGYGPGQRVGPVAEYDHDLGCSVTGGHVYRGRAVPSATGRYFYGDYCSGNIWSLVIREGRATDIRREAFTIESISSFGEDARGELYLVSHGGTIYRLAG